MRLVDSHCHLQIGPVPRRSRRGRRLGARGRHRADPRARRRSSRPRALPWRSSIVTRGWTRRSASIRMSPPTRRRRRGRWSRSSRVTSGSSGSARPASTTTAGSRRVTRSSRTSVAISRSRSSSGSRRSCTAGPGPENATPRTTSSPSWSPPASACPTRAQRSGTGRRPSFTRCRVRSTTSRPPLALGLAVSVSGLAFRRGEEPTADAVRLVPADRILVETDGPYLAAARRAASPERPGMGGDHGSLDRRTSGRGRG